MDKPEFFRLNNQVKYYEWGSPRWIPDLLGVKNTEGRPWAEMWMGSHPLSPSTVIVDGAELPLGDLAAADAQYCPGKYGAEKFGGIPFLLKLLAAEKPLSIQAHPNLSQAREGFQRENDAGIALDDPRRNYKDANHKPEIICALGPFTGMCGFREPREIGRLLGEVFARNDAAPLRDGLAPLFAALENPDSSRALKNFLSALFALVPAAREQIGAYIRQVLPRRRETSSGSGLSPAIRETMIRFAEMYPDDPAVLSPVYLNLFELKPGEAVFLGAGTLHAYIHGFGVELMANSDNVLRGGLTSKHIDAGELMDILDFTPAKPRIISPPETAPRYTYPAPCGEFSLTVMRGSGNNETFFQSGPAVCVVTAGKAEIAGNRDRAFLKSGESVFIPRAAGPLAFRGKFTLYAASLPDEPPQKVSAVSLALRSSETEARSSGNLLYRLL